MRSFKDEWEISDYIRGINLQCPDIDITHLVISDEDYSRIIKRSATVIHYLSDTVHSTIIYSNYQWEVLKAAKAMMEKKK